MDEKEKTNYEEQAETSYQESPRRKYHPASLPDVIDAVRRVVEMYRDCGLIADNEARCKKAADVLDKLVEAAV